MRNGGREQNTNGRKEGRKEGRKKENKQRERGRERDSGQKHGNIKFKYHPFVQLAKLLMGTTL